METTTLGDRVIEMVANTLQHNVRSTDHVGRWTGEKFLIDPTLN